MSNCARFLSWNKYISIKNGDSKEGGMESAHRFHPQNRTFTFSFYYERCTLIVFWEIRPSVGGEIWNEHCALVFSATVIVFLLMDYSLCSWQGHDTNTRANRMCFLRLFMSLSLMAVTDTNTLKTLKLFLVLVVVCLEPTSRPVF